MVNVLFIQGSVSEKTKNTSPKPAEIRDEESSAI